MNAVIIAAAVIITALIFSYTIRNRNKSNNIISVTGSGTKEFESDLIVWNGSFSKKALQLREAYAALDSDRGKIKSYLVSKGVKAEQIVFSAVDIQKEMDETFDNNGRRISAVFSGYRLQQSVQIESREVDKIEGISREVSELINNGVEFYSTPPEYYYTKLKELKIEMIAEATKDASQRAKRIAENSGSDVGELKSADMGVFQIVAQNSSEEFTWGGSFNTTSKRKTANITVKLQYGVD